MYCCNFAYLQYVFKNLYLDAGYYKLYVGR